MQKVSCFGIEEQKKSLRTYFLKKRRQDFIQSCCFDWGPAQFQKARLLFSEDKWSSFRIASYFPIQNELCLNKEVQSNWLFPAMDSAQKKLLWFEYGDGQTDYVLNSYGIWEKPLNLCFDLNPLNFPLLCFVPALVASRSGHRLGYGKGYYDRWISSCKSKELVTVLCLPNESYILDEIPFFETDQTVDFIVY